MSKRRGLVVAASLIGLIVVIYGGASLQLYLSARGAIANVKKISTQLSNVATSGPGLATHLAELSGTMLRIEHQINRPFWRPMVWVSGQSVKFEQLQNSIVEGRALLAVAPGLLGIDSPRRYLIAFQNPAEARGTGGIIGGYASIEVDKGHVKVLRLGSNAQLHSLEAPPIFISKDFSDIYGTDPGIWQNSNMSPHFPYGAQIWLALWQRQFNENLDGVIAVDPIAMSYLLKVIGPVTMADNRVITSENIVQETLSLEYQRFASANALRKSYLTEIARAILQRMTAGNYSKVQLGRQLYTPWMDGRLLFYSAHPSEESALAKTHFGGVLNSDAKNEFRAVVENTAGNKMDYYLDRVIRIRSLSCSPLRQTEISVTLTNTVSASAKLPAYVVGRLDLKAPNGEGNSHGVSLFIYGPPGATLTSGKTVGSPENSSVVGRELARSVLITRVNLTPGKAQSIRATFSGGSGPISYISQPLVRPDSVEIKDSCR